MFYFSWETNTNWVDVGPWFKNNLWLPFFLSVIYVAGVFGGQYLMKSRPAYDLKNFLVYWNGFLTILSWALAIRLVPMLIWELANGGFRFSLCTEQFTDAPCGVWVMVFVLSKVPELLDTAWLVLRKKEVILLHWYHHWSVLCYSWHSYAYRMPTGLWFQAMNAVVHSFMYLYYTLTSMGQKPKWNMVLTVGQILQMVLGVVFSLNDLLNTGCGNRTNSIFGSIMYLSYFVLFAHLFYSSYCVGKKRRVGDNETSSAPATTGKAAKDANGTTKSVNPTTPRKTRKAD
jgi:elongation of very long chain fatty acids protein 6